MKVIVGLGNPGKKYELTRHNIGFMAIDNLKKHFDINEEKNKFQALISEKNINGEKVLLVKPQTFMNLSGNSLREIINFYKLDPKEDVVVIYDDMDLPIEQLRIRLKGSSGGHNGIKSIIENIGEEFVRLKCGIGKKDRDAIEHVLGKFSQTEQEKIEEMIKEVVNCVIDILNTSKLEQIIQNYNKKKIKTC
ncbi:MAG: aminoacyl-tRNA hydrolase [Fusobacteriales bacterium]|nr:MAG: aminoacyl-tRNA hydrolase [Fusobacteriales bacterium]